MDQRAAGDWPTDVVDVLGGDLVAALAYRTPAQGAVVLPISTLGLVDPAARTVSFTTPFAGYRKLRRLHEDGRVALAFHAREHGSADPANQLDILVQGDAVVDREPDPDFLDWLYRERWPLFAPPRPSGAVWDRLTGHYYDARVRVTVTVRRISAQPRPGRPRPTADVLYGPALPTTSPDEQPAPHRPDRPRVAARRWRRRMARSAHVLIGWVDSDGYPVIRRTGWERDGQHIRLTPAQPVPGRRRAGLLGHWFGPRLLPQGSAVFTGWLDADGRTYTPHTVAGYVAPGNARLATVGTALATRPLHRRAQREGLVTAGRWSYEPTESESTAPG
ncbi:MAG: hypothetical protein D6683_16390 [Actinomyces sp.]|nr:MAG: hypothetical protein D6683_16390 [Actinomyces sp.]